MGHDLVARNYKTILVISVGLTFLAWSVSQLDPAVKAVLVLVALTPLLWVGCQGVEGERPWQWQRCMIQAGVAWTFGILGLLLPGFIGTTLKALALFWAVSVVLCQSGHRYAHKFYLEELRRRRTDEEAAARAEDERKREEGRAARRKFDAIINSADRILIDTNIWLEPGLHRMLRLLATAATSNQRPLTMIGAEFEEIVRLKGAREPDRASKARQALRFVEHLLTENILSIERIPFENVRGAYFDRVAQQVTARELSRGRRVAIITDDTELRIRLRAGNSVNVDMLALHTKDDFPLPTETTDLFLEGFNPTSRGDGATKEI